jgi:hypothetical protein
MKLFTFSPSDEGVNRWLKERFGMSGLDGSKQKYRVIWSTNLTEKRLGDYTDYVPNTQIFLRQIREVRETLKYPFDQDRWVLERYVAHNNPELVESRQGYEVIRIFKGPDGQFLPLNRRVIEIFVQILEGAAEKVNPVALLEEMREKAESDQLARDEAMIGDMMRSPYFHDLVE